ncbi:ATP-binding cassette domain-containing protein [Rhabdaerophilum sp. SD176]|uniref:ABC transporter ATP-binding protein n=1 Tax=Rhabdaerophilum sp. SD176 TaxID=2983548 RepID=UPI0024DFFAF6|nr:ATP-binding cassette domain-containing protein [Rhabdaerophilum sp. SD176]
MAGLATAFSVVSEPVTSGAAAIAAPYLSLVGLTKRFGSAVVVRDVNLDVPRGELLCILGPSGCGKTTLLRLIAGFEAADSGSIRQAGSEISALPPEARDFGIVFQSYALFPNRSAARNIGFGLETLPLSRTERTARIRELLALVGLEGHADKYPSQLSGGQQQRVALARALALSPGLLLLDEPLSALDANVRASLRDELRQLQRRIGITSIMVTHDQQEALSIADRVVVMNAGRIEQIGTPAELYQRPANLFVARFLGEVNALPVTSISGNIVQAGGHAFRLGGSPVPGGSAGYLCFRPSAVRIGMEAAGGAAGTRGRVSSMAFLGDRLRLEIQPEIQNGGPFVAEIPFPRFGNPPGLGDHVTVSVEPDQLFLLDDHG